MPMTKEEARQRLCNIITDYNRMLSRYEKLGFLDIEALNALDAKGHWEKRR